MTFVELVDALRIESAASGERITTVQGNLKGETERLKKWVKDSWLDIQRKHTDWQFLFVQSSYTLPVNASVLNPTEYDADEVAEWKVNTFRIAEAGGARKDSKPFLYRDYFDWRDREGLDVTIPGIPQSFTIHPTTEALHIAPPSDTARILFYDYWRNPQILEDDDDVPLIPARYHDLIPYWALKKYGFYEVAPEAITRADSEINRLLAELEMDQLPTVTYRGLLD